MQNLVQAPICTWLTVYTTRADKSFFIAFIRSCCFSSTLLIFFDRHNHIYTILVTSPKELCTKKCIKDHLCHLDSNYSCTERNHICIIMFSCHLCRIWFRTHRCADTVNLIGCHGNSKTGSTDCNSEIHFSVCNCGIA